MTLLTKKEDYHGNTAVQYRCTNIVNKIRHISRSSSDPNAVYRIYNTGYYAKCNRIPNDLPGKIPLAAENDISLYWEIDYLTQYHGYHISAKNKASHHVLRHSPKCSI